MKRGTVTVSRVHSTVTYPSSFLLIGAMNPCPCGYLGSNQQYCTCSEKQILSYRNRLSGPIYDRMDILLSLQSINFDQPVKRQETSDDIRVRVEKARNIQYNRYQTEVTNAKVPFEWLTNRSPLTQRMLTKITAKQNWSNRVQVKITRLARTISDLAEEKEITDGALWEAFRLRRWSIQKQQSVAGQT